MIAMLAAAQGGTRNDCILMESQVDENRVKTGRFPRKPRNPAPSQSLSLSAVDTTAVTGAIYPTSGSA
jgi:hypothetical protein